MVRGVIVGLMYHGGREGDRLESGAVSPSARMVARATN